MSEDAHDSNNAPDSGDEDILARSKSAHELLRTAVSLLESGDTLLITLEVAMELMMEWDNLKAGVKGPETRPEFDERDNA